MLVHEIPTHEEFFGLIDNEITEDELDFKNKDEKIKELMVIAVSLLHDFYVEHKYYDAHSILSQDFERELANLHIELEDLINSLFEGYVYGLHDEYDLNYTLPTGVVETDLDLDKVIALAVTSVITQLQTDLESKAGFYVYLATTTGAFSLHANFRRAMKKLANAVDYNAQYTKALVERKYLEFVYGQEKLFYWRCSGVNTCEWCYGIEAMGAMPLSYFPVDHPNGGCRLIPFDEFDYSKEYLEIMGW